MLHRERWGLYLPAALPIEELLPGVEENDRRRVIDREINRLIPLVDAALHRVSIETRVALADFEFDLEAGKQKKVNHWYELIEHYFQLPRDGRKAQDFFQLLMETLERGIGALEEARRMAVRRAFSPITWLAWIVEIPIIVLARAGVPMEDASSKGVQAVAWVLRLGMLAAVAFAATKLGVSLPWEKLGALLK